MRLSSSTNVFELALACSTGCGDRVLCHVSVIQYYHMFAKKLSRCKF